MIKIILDTEDIALILFMSITFIVVIGCAIKDKIEEVKENRKKKKEEKECR